MTSENSGEPILSSFRDWLRQWHNHINDQGMVAQTPGQGGVIGGILSENVAESDAILLHTAGPPPGWLALFEEQGDRSLAEVLAEQIEYEEQDNKAVEGQRKEPAESSTTAMDFIEAGETLVDWLLKMQKDITWFLQQMGHESTVNSGTKEDDKKGINDYEVPAATGEMPDHLLEFDPASPPDNELTQEAGPGQALEKGREMIAERSPTKTKPPSVPVVEPIENFPSASEPESASPASLPGLIIQPKKAAAVDKNPPDAIGDEASTPLLPSMSVTLEGETHLTDQMAAVQPEEAPASTETPASTQDLLLADKGYPTTPRTSVAATPLDQRSPDSSTPIYSKLPDQASINVGDDSPKPEPATTGTLPEATASSLSDVSFEESANDGMRIDLPPPAPGQPLQQDVKKPVAPPEPLAQQIDLNPRLVWRANPDSITSPSASETTVTDPELENSTPLSKNQLPKNDRFTAPPLPSAGTRKPGQSKRVTRLQLRPVAAKKETPRMPSVFNRFQTEHNPNVTSEEYPGQTPGRPTQIRQPLPQVPTEGDAPGPFFTLPPHLDAMVQKQLSVFLDQAALKDTQADSSNPPQEAANIERHKQGESQEADQSKGPDASALLPIPASQVALNLSPLSDKLQERLTTNPPPLSFPESESEQSSGPTAELKKGMSVEENVAEPPPPRFTKFPPLPERSPPKWSKTLSNRWPKLPDPTPTYGEQDLAGQHRAARRRRLNKEQRGR